MTDGASSSARQTLYGIGDGWHVDVCAASPLALCRFSSRISRFFRCPEIGSDPPSFLRFLMRRMRECDYDLLLPTHEEVYLLSRFESLLEQKSRFAVPPLAALRAMLGKVEFAITMNSLGLPIPRFEILESIDDLDRYDRFPFFLKRNFGTAGRGVTKIENVSGRQTAIEKLRSEGHSAAGSIRLLAQQPAAGQMCVAQAVFGRGELVAVHSARVLRSGVGGGSLLRVSTEQPRVVDDLRRLGRHLKWHGALFLEYFWDPEKQTPNYIECNPRIGEPENARLSGVDLVAALASVSLDPFGATAGAFGRTKPGVRSHIGFVALIGHAIEGGSRRELYRQWRAMARREGPFAEAENEMTRPAEDVQSLIPAAFVTAQLLLRPATAEKLVEDTVRSYALPRSAVEQIENMDEPSWESLNHSGIA